jgi:hypothetical protein
MVLFPLFDIKGFALPGEPFVHFLSRIVGFVKCIAGFQDIMLVGCAIAGLGIFTSLARGPRQQ